MWFANSELSVLELDEFTVESPGAVVDQDGAVLEVDGLAAVFAVGQSAILGVSL